MFEKDREEKKTKRRGERGERQEAMIYREKRERERQTESYNDGNIRDRGRLKHSHGESRLKKERKTEEMKR